MSPFAQRVALCAFVLTMSLGVRMAAAYWWQARLPAGQSYAFGDSDGYVHLAGTIAHGEPYQYGSADLRVFRTPGYPLLIAPLYWLSGGTPPPMAIRALNACLGTCAVAGVMGLTGLLFNFRAAMLAGGLATIYPGAISMSVFILSEAPFCPLMLVQLIAWALAWRSSARREMLGWGVLAGVTAGVATLMRPSWLLFTPFAIVIGLVVSQDRARQVTLGLTMLAACALTLMPWWIRNYQVAGTFVPTTLQVGASLYDGLHSTATGASEMSFVNGFREELHQSDSLLATAPSQPFEVRLDAHLKQAAVSWATAHPAEVIQLAGRKFIRMWSPWPNDASFNGWLMGTVTAAGFLPLLVASLWGAWRYVPQGWPYALCVLPALYFTLLHMVFVSSLRYRQPAMLVLIVLAAGAICHVRRIERETIADS